MFYNFLNLKMLLVRIVFVPKLYSRNLRNRLRCKLLIVGGGTGGCSVAWRLAKKLNDRDIIILEPSKVHYYQPLFTLVSAGVKKFTLSHRPTKSVLPRNVLWIKDVADDFDPCNNVVYTGSGLKVRYDQMVVAVGLKNDYDEVIGLKKALDDPLSQVSTTYSPDYCQKCWCRIQNFKGGHALFTFPKQPGKCSGAAQKIMYMAHDHWRLNKINPSTNITYNTAGDVLFGIPKYATALQKVAIDRNITVNYKLELIEVTLKEAIFLDCFGQTISLPYKFLHVTPPMSTPNCLLKCEELTTSGYLDVDRNTLQHVRYKNVFGIGDCLNTPNSKTAAAISKQSQVVERNIWQCMYGKDPTAKYDGYCACPVLTSYKTGMLAEFVYDKIPCETFPFDQAYINLAVFTSTTSSFIHQLEAWRTWDMFFDIINSKESRIIYFVNNNIFPYIYWNKLLKGKWNGPSRIRKIINPFGK